MTFATYRTTRTQQFQSKTGRYVGIGLVVVLHLALGYLFLNALKRGAIELVHGPVEVSEIKEEKPQEKETPPPPPDFKPPPPPFVPPPEINVATPVANNTAAIAATTQKALPPPPPPPPKEEVVVNPKPLNKVEVSEEDYPPIEKRLGHEGVVTLEFKVGVDGKATEIHVSKSSGYPRLDQRAIELFEARAKFQPGTVNGQTAALTAHVNIRFQLSD